MKKKQKQITFSTYLLLFVILVLLIVTFKVYSHVDIYKEEIKVLKAQLVDQKELENLKELTDEFIEKSSVGQHKHLLTGSAKEEYELALENKGVDEEEHLEEEGHLDSYDLINVFVEKIDEETARSYAIYKVYYENNPNSEAINSQRILFLSLTLDWEKTKKGYKVYDYKIDLLQDSLDQQLQEMSRTNEGE